jgi:hypothetical protein
MNIVVARYNENIDWLYDIKEMFENIFIYNKGGEVTFFTDNCKVEKLTNIGREAHTYLHFIVNNYDDILKNPSEIYIFTQAQPNNGIETFRKKLNSLHNNEIQNFPMSMTDTSGVENFFPHLGSVKDPVHSNGIPFDQYFKHLFYTIDKKSEHRVNYHALWATKSSNITFRKKEFYVYCYNMFKDLKNPIESYIFERLWQYIFNTDYLDWISHYDTIRNFYISGRWHGLEIE